MKKIGFVPGAGWKSLTFLRVGPTSAHSLQGFGNPFIRQGSMSEKTRHPAHQG
jgi:hypothetical protein